MLSLYCSSKRLMSCLTLPLRCTKLKTYLWVSLKCFPGQPCFSTLTYILPRGSCLNIYVATQRTYKVGWKIPSVLLVFKRVRRQVADSWKANMMMLGLHDVHIILGHMCCYCYLFQRLLLMTSTSHLHTTLVCDNRNIYSTTIKDKLHK